jgi:flagellar protein FlaG
LGKERRSDLPYLKTNNKKLKLRPVSSERIFDRKGQKFLQEGDGTMDTKIPNIKPMVLEPWLVPEQNIKEPVAVKPVPKSEGASFRKLDRERNSRQHDASFALDPDKAKQLAEEIQRYLSEFHVNLSFEVSDRTGDVVVKVVNSDTKEVIRQIPPEDLVKILDKLEELRGVIFARKA